MRYQTYRKLPNKLNRHRRQCELTQKQVATVFGMKSPSRICRWERGSALPNLLHAIRLSMLYEVPIDSLFPKHRMAIIKELLEEK